MTSVPQGMSVQLHVPYSEHAKAPVGPITMGLPLTMDPKKLGKGPGPPPGCPGLGSCCVRVGVRGGQLGPWTRPKCGGAGGTLMPSQCWPQPLAGWGGSPAHPCVSLSQRLCSLSLPSPAPFSGVKQEQLSPRGQVGPPESLGVPTAQETSVLRGEGRGRAWGWHLPASPRLPLCSLEAGGRNGILHPKPAGKVQRPLHSRPPRRLGARGPLC